MLLGDLSEVPVEELVTAVRLAFKRQDEQDQWIRKALASLNQQGMSYDEIGRRVGITRSKANRWAKPFS